MNDFSIKAKGLDGVIVGDTVLSMVDGDKGELVYRGYNIDELASCSFEKVCYLFLYGNLADQNEENKLSIKVK